MSTVAKPEKPTNILPIPPSNHSDSAPISRATWLGRVVQQVGPKVALASAVGGTMSLAGILTAGAAGVCQSSDGFFVGITLAGLGNVILLTIMGVNALSYQRQRALPVEI